MTTKTVQVPKPVTLTAILPSEGHKDGRITVHHYKETRECEVEGPAYEYIYTCVETGVERRWGLIDRIDFEAN